MGKSKSKSKSKDLGQSSTNIGPVIIVLFTLCVVAWLIFTVMNGNATSAAKGPLEGPGAASAKSESWGGVISANRPARIFFPSTRSTTTSAIGGATSTTGTTLPFLATNNPSSTLVPTAVPTAPLAPVPTALQMRSVELDTTMSMRFMYARGIGMRPATMHQPQCAVSVDCYETLASRNKYKYCVVVIDLVSAPTTETPVSVLVVTDDEDTIEFTTTPAVLGSRDGPATEARFEGKTHIVYSFTIPTTRGSLRGASSRVRVRVHSSVDRAVFLWSESAPKSTAGL